MVSRILFSPIPNYFSPNLLLVLTYSKWIFVWESKYKKMPKYPLIFIEKTKTIHEKKTITNRQSMQELWKQDSWNHLMSRSHVQVPKSITWDWFFGGVHKYYEINLSLPLISPSWLTSSSLLSLILSKADRGRGDCELELGCCYYTV